MSTIVILSVFVAIAAIIGLRVYIEHKEEKELENLKQQVEDDKNNAVRFVQEEALVEQQPVSVEHLVVNTPNPTFADVENINSAEAQAEAKPKKKKRYYGNRKPKAKSNSNKQTKNKL